FIVANGISSLVSISAQEKEKGRNASTAQQIATAGKGKSAGDVRKFEAATQSAFPFQLSQFSSKPDSSKSPGSGTVSGWPEPYLSLYPAKQGYRNRFAG